MRLASSAVPKDAVIFRPELLMALNQALDGVGVGAAGSGSNGRSLRRPSTLRHVADGDGCGGSRQVVANVRIWCQPLRSGQ